MYFNFKTIYTITLTNLTPGTYAKTYKVNTDHL